MCQVTIVYRSLPTQRYLSELNDDKGGMQYVAESKSVLKKLKGLIKGNNGDELTTKERLAKMGLAALLSYGWVSNMSYAVCTGLAWFTFAKQTGITPLAPGQWKKFLAVYSGFFIFNNALRPVRFGLSVAVAGLFDRFINYIQEKTKARKGVAIGIVVFLFNVCGTFGAMALGIVLASAASGVAIFPSKV